MLFIHSNDSERQKGGRGIRNESTSRRKFPKLREQQIKMEFVGANPQADGVGIGPLAGRANFYFGSDPAHWRQNVPSYSKVEYSGVYPGVDATYYGSGNRLEYDLVVAPGADASAIRLRFSGTRKVFIDGQNGDLVVVTMDGTEIRFRKPNSHQPGDEFADRKVESEFSLVRRQEVAFKLGPYDSKLPLVIDPVLDYSTYVGGTRVDANRAMAVDQEGDLFLGGFTSSYDYPIANAYQTTNVSGSTAFLSKLSPDGSSLIYSTYLGGSATDGIYGIATDSAGNAYVTGIANSLDFPTTPGAYRTMCGVGATCTSRMAPDLFVAKFGPDGTLIYSTYLGGSSDDEGQAIAADTSGNAYVTGVTKSADYPTTPGAYPGQNPGAAGFITKLNPDGTALVYSAILGQGDGGSGIFVDSSGNAYVGGSAAPSYPTTPGAYRTDPSKGGAFITKVNPAGSDLIYSAIVGGVLSESGIGVDSAGSACITGQVFNFSTGFPLVNAFQPTLNGVADAYVTKLSPDGTHLLYSTLLGGSGDEFGTAITVDSTGNGFVTGLTQSSDFPTRNPFQPNCSNCSSSRGDAFVTEFDPSGGLVFSSFLGGGGDDQGEGVALGPSGKLFVAGTTHSQDFPISNAYQAAPVVDPSYICNSLCSNSFGSRIDLTQNPAPDFALTASTTAISVNPGETAIYNLQIVGVGGFDSNVSFTCSGAPPKGSCVVGPSPSAPNGVEAVSLTASVATATSTAAAPPGDLYLPNFPNFLTRQPGAWSILFILLAAIASWVFTHRSRSLRLAMVVAVFGLSLSCGGGGSAGSGGSKTQPGTPAGTYTVTITATSGSITHSLLLQTIVK